MKPLISGGERIRREVMIRIIRDFTAGKLAETIDALPLAIRPKSMLSPRCCIYHDRAILKYRVMALLGFSYEDETDENRPLRSYLEEALAGDSVPEFPLTVCGAACFGCVDNGYEVTSACRGCSDRPCVYACPADAISTPRRFAEIDYSKCIQCGRCRKACPFSAVIKTAVPCEDACPVGAIRKNKNGVAAINHKTCMFCGNCFRKCPFSTIMERSQLIKILQKIAEGKKVIALVAPAAEAQFPGTVEQLFSAIHKTGFADILEVALGAELTAEHEAKEFQERMLAGEKIMSSSCCTPVVEIVKRHAPQFHKHVSTTPSPMIFAGRLAREKHPDGVNVFIGPCIAKRYEALAAAEIDHVMTFEELGVLLAGKHVDILLQEPWPIPRPAAATARSFARTCGVTEAVLHEMETKPEFQEIGFRLDSRYLDGIDRKTPGVLKRYAQGKLPGNFLEVMSCQGGCVNGPCSLVEESL